MAEIAAWASMVLFVGLMAYAALSDIFTMLIPNRISAALIVGFLVAAPLVGLDWSAIGMHLLVGGIGFCVACALFAAGVVGGGDAKLGAAVALWMGPVLVVDFIFYMALAGGVLAALFLVLRRLVTPATAGSEGWVGRLMQTDGGIPYAVAIAAGTIPPFGKGLFMMPFL